MKKLLAWAERRVQSPYAWPIFSFLVFIEAFFFMPVINVMILYGISRPKQLLRLGILSTIFSILGAATAYGMGLLLWHIGFQNILFWLISPEKFQACAATYRCCEVGSVFLGSFAPFLPFKAITLTAGFCQLPFLPYIVSIAAGRAVRNIVLTTTLYYFGSEIQRLIDRYLYFIIAFEVIFIAIGLTWLLYK